MPHVITVLRKNKGTFLIETLESVCLCSGETIYVLLSSRCDQRVYSSDNM